MTITKIKLLPRTTIKAKSKTSFSGSVEAGNGIVVDHAGNVYTISLDGDVVQTVVDDINVTGDFTSGVLTLGWTGILAPDRGGAGTGIAGYHLAGTGVGTASTYQGFTQDGTGAVPRTWQAKAEDFKSVLDFIPVAEHAAILSYTSATDVSAYINAATLAHRRIFFPAGQYRVTTTLQLRSGGHMIGAGRGATILKQSTAATAMFTIGSAIDYASIQHMTLDRVVAATAGGDGIQQTATCDNIFLNDLVVTAQYVGISVGSTGYSRMANVTSKVNISHGILLSSADGGGAFQWNLNDIFVAVNGGDGIRVDSAATTAGAAMGNWVHISSFNNTGNDLRFNGATAKPISAIRVTSCFVGESLGAAGAIVLDTYSSAGFVHTFTDCYLEASANGFFVTANNGPVVLTDFTAVTMVGEGVHWDATSELTIVGGLTANNGTNGVTINAGSAKITGLSSGSGGGGAQNRGLHLAAGTGPHSIAGNNFNYGTGNVTNNLNDLSTHADSKIGPNVGVTDTTGTGLWVRATAPTMTLANATGLPIATGVSGLGTNVATFLATPSSANLIAALTDETGTGAAVFANTPTLVTPVLGAATATSVNFGGSTLSVYAVGTWTPNDASGAGLTFAAANGGYTRIGNMVFAYGFVTYPATADGSAAIIGNLPFTVANNNQARQCSVTATTEATLVQMIPNANTTTITLYTNSLGALTNVTMSADLIFFIATYPIT